MPCKYTFQGHHSEILKLKKALQLVNHSCDAFQRENYDEQKNDSDEPPAKKARSSDYICVEASMDEVNSAADKFQLWLQFGKDTLDTRDRMCLVEGRELSDKHVNFAQGMIKSQFSGTGTSITGLYSTLVQQSSQNVISLSSNAIQIIHCRQNHWATITTIGCAGNQVKVYDSVY